MYMFLLNMYLFTGIIGSFREHNHLFRTYPILEIECLKCCLCNKKIDYNDYNLFKLAVGQ